MIHVQIASELTADGVRGTRWVLLEDAEPLLPAADMGVARAVDPPAHATAALAPAVDAPPAVTASDSVADSLRLRVLKALVVVLGLGAALWTAAVQIGPPGRSVPGAAGAATGTAKPAIEPTGVPPPSGAAPHAMPTLPRPLPAASAPSAAPAASVAAPQSATGTPDAPASAGLPRLTASL